jgi:hypothetical protein
MTEVVKEGPENMVDKIVKLLLQLYSMLSYGSEIKDIQQEIKSIIPRVENKEQIHNLSK